MNALMRISGVATVVKALLSVRSVEVIFYSRPSKGIFMLFRRDSQNRAAKR